jgi:tetratricopeptide (TPR) repeat protein
MTEAKRKRVEQLSERGYACLRQREYKSALRFAKRLERLRYTAAFEIAGLAYAGLDDLETAVKTLERGVDLAPDCWLNWQLLGNYRSDLGRYEEAAIAYGRALTCPQVWEDSIRLNQAILANRREDYATALAFLDAVKDDQLTLQAASVRARALEGAGRPDESISLAEKCLAGDWQEDSAGEHLAYIAATMARVRLARGGDPANVRQFALDSLQYDANNRDLLAFIRDLDGRFSPQAQYYRLLVHRLIAEDDPLRAEMRGYFVQYDVVAETVAQALEWVGQFESVTTLDALSAEESDALEPRPQSPMGVYRRGGRYSYLEEDAL